MIYKEDFTFRKDFGKKRIELHKYIKENIIKDKKDFKVLDIGGGLEVWPEGFVTHSIDLFANRENKQNPFIKNFAFDLDDYEKWDEIFEFVNKNGKFDFVTCTHTLEDINAPFLTLTNINKISNSGFIAVPSIYSEFYKGEFYYPKEKPINNYKGCYHHRWIYKIINGVFTGFPKQGFLEYLSSKEIDDKISKDNYFCSEISFFWKDKVEFDFIKPFELLNNEFGKNRIYELFD